MAPVTSTWAHLITGIAMATEHHPDPAAATDRLLGLVVAGVSPVT
ncbi:hypothetical protein ACQEVF_45090 [Nonomuraea polychroma]